MIFARIHRRQMLVLLCAGILLLLFYYMLVLSPALTRQLRLEKRIADKEAELAQMRELSREWVQLNSRRSAAEKRIRQRKAGFTLLSFLEGISREAGIQSKIQYMKPRVAEEQGSKTEGMEIKLDGIRIEQLVDFLYQIEYSDHPLSIRRIKIQKPSRGTDDSLGVTIQVDAYTPA